MEVVVLVLSGLVVVRLARRLSGWLRQRRRRETSSGSDVATGGSDGVTGVSDPVDQEVAVPNFRVVALGVTGSGKTTFLASMFHGLHVPSNGRPYFLETRLEDRVRLATLFGQVADTTAAWPRGTYKGETREFTFDCVALQDEGRYPVFRMSYLDYAGELLELEQEAGSDALADLESRINGAHALLGILDGLRILQYLRKEPAGRAYFHSTLQPMIGVMAEASCPIQFVVTKWDIVKGFGEPNNADDNTRLRIVRDALMANTHIEALVSMHRQGNSVVRLLPVSAVGSDFARVNPDGQVVKLQDGELRPTNLELPFSVILPDLFSQIEASLDESLPDEVPEQLRSLRQFDRTRWVAAAAKFLSLPAGILLQGGLGGILGAPQADELIRPVLDWVTRPLDMMRDVNGDADKVALQAAQLQKARDRVFKEFEHTLWHLESHLPASVLTRG